MDSRYRFLTLTLGIPWTRSMLSRDVNTATKLVEASWRHDKMLKYSSLYMHIGCFERLYICRQETNGRLYFKRYDF